MYVARANEIYVIQDKEELFITVHPTDTGGTVSIEEQTSILVSILNNLHQRWLSSVGRATVL